MLDYNTAVLNEYQRREALEDKAVADWESYHGTVLPQDMDIEQAEEFLATADEYEV
ncbi:host nuclease inhibitor, partial [Mycobacterium kansasii]